MNTNDRSLRVFRDALPDGEVGKFAQRENREAVGSRMSESDR